jgi:site-specific DNA-methyltransferase (adenine-specific)
MNLDSYKWDWVSPDGNIRLACADCLQVLPTLEAESVHAVITDPPYAIPTIVASGRSNTSNLGDLSLIESAFRGLFNEWRRVIGDAGRTFVFCDGVSYPVLFRAVYGKLATALLVWAKLGIGMGREFRKSHELILHAWAAKTPIFSDGIGRADVLTYPMVPTDERQHPAEKPADLIEELLTVCGPIVCDPFMGSGTSGVACVRTGRKFIGIEISEEYFDIAVKRIEAELNRHPLLEPKQPTQGSLLP